jgi:peptide/nickel transport system permease protein
MTTTNTGQAAPGITEEQQLDIRPKQGAGKRVATFCRTKPLGAVSAAIIILTIFTAVFAPLIAPYDPLDLTHEPFISPSASAWLGADELGRDVFSRVIFGARVSMYVGVVSVIIGISLGTIIGIISAYVGGVIDLTIQRIVDALMAFPAIIMALGLTAVLGSSVNNIVAALVVILLPGAIRVIRAQVLSIKELDYTLAAQAIGARPWRIMLRHILPNVVASFIVLSTITLGLAIIIEASLTFLGVGISADIPTWGGMLTEGAQKYIRTAWWLAVFPGLAISIVVFAINFLGDALRDALDPRLRGR